VADNIAAQPVSRISYIDGLRGVAVLGVILFHLDVGFISGGFVGVDIFFVISGFLITRIIVQEHRVDQFSFANFYARRIRRIFPALFVMLFISSLAAVVFLGPQEFAAFFKDLRFASAQFSNILFSKQIDYFALKKDHSPLLHTWSLGVEEQFYFIWPLLLILAYKFFPTRKIYIVLMAVMIVGLGLSEYLVQTNALHAFYMLDSRAWELAMGGIVALGVLPQPPSENVRNFLGVGGVTLIFIAMVFTQKLSFPGLWAVLPCLGTASILYAGGGEHRGVAYKLLSVRPLVFIGLISYSLYLWHWPIIEFYRTLRPAEMPASLDATEQISLLTVSLIFAALSYKFVEKTTSRITARPLVIILAGVFLSLVFIASSNIIKKESYADWRVTYHVDFVETRPNNYFKTCASSLEAITSEACIIGPHKDSYEVILAGDSHASHYTPAVLAWAKEKGYTVRLITRGACQAWVTSAKPPIKDGAIDEECLAIRKEFYDTLNRQPSIRYVFLSLKLPKTNEDIYKSLSAITAFNKKVFFLGSLPLFAEDPHHCMIKNHLLITRILPPQTKAGENCQSFDDSYINEQLAPVLTEFVPLLGKFNIPYFDPRTAMQSPFDEKGHFLYMDTDHLNEYGGEFLGESLIKYMTQFPD